MPVISFKSQFSPLILKGQKTQTIRKQRKLGPYEKGKVLYLYENLRAKNRRLLKEAICTEVLPIRIDNRTEKVFIDGNCLTKEEVRDLATKDGFISSYEFYKFFLKNYGLIFEGVLIKWS